MSDPLATHFVANATGEFRGLKSLADKAIAQVDDADFFFAADSESNSIAINVKHVAGNLKSRWTDFLTTDGEKPDRNRDGEFVIGAEDTRTALLERWEAGWRILFGALAALDRTDLLSTVPIRGEPHTIVEAVQRQLTHYGYHVGQIVYLAKRRRGGAWKTLSVPRNRSAEFNTGMQAKHGAR